MVHQTHISDSVNPQKNQYLYSDKCQLRPSQIYLQSYL